MGKMFVLFDDLSVEHLSISESEEEIKMHAIHMILKEMFDHEYVHDFEEEDAKSLQALIDGDIKGSFDRISQWSDICIVEVDKISTSFNIVRESARNLLNEYKRIREDVAEEDARIALEAAERESLLKKEREEAEHQEYLRLKAKYEK